MVDKECVLEAALEPAATAILAAAAVGSENDQYQFPNHLNHFDLDIGQYQELPAIQPPVTSTDYLHNNSTGVTGSRFEQDFLTFDKSL